MKTITVHVTQEDIDSNLNPSPQLVRATQCPLALATERELGMPVYVFGNGVMHRKGHLSNILLSTRANRFVNRADKVRWGAGGPALRPQSFRLQVPE